MENTRKKCEVHPVTGSFKDERDGNIYKTVKIGDLEWFAENFRYNCEGATAYEDDEKNAEKYGYLYTWETAVNAAPAGWRLPTKNEIINLFDLAGGRVSAETLKSKTDWCKPHRGEGGCGKDLFGFSVLPAGYRFHRVVGFVGIGLQAYFWSSDEDPEINKKLYYRFAYDDNMAHIGYEYNSALMSVRYVRE